MAVDLTWSATSLCIKVGDRGPGARSQPSPDAHGLVGMRERVRIHGGELTSGNLPEGGFAIQALLPIGA